MCTISGTCGCNGGTGSFLLALTGRALWELVKLLAKAVQLVVVALVAITLWAAPRGWRLARRGYHAGRQRWLTRPVALDQRQPIAVLPDKPTAPTLRDLMQKQEANAR